LPETPRCTLASRPRATPVAAAARACGGVDELSVAFAQRAALRVRLLLPKASHFRAAGRAAGGAHARAAHASRCQWRTRHQRGGWHKAVVRGRSRRAERGAKNRWALSRARGISRCRRAFAPPACVPGAPRTRAARGACAPAAAAAAGRGSC
jgi:hypothetical protein